MKKIIFLFGVLSVCLGVNIKAQESATYDYKLPYSDSWFSTAFTSSNITSATDSIWYYSFWTLTKLPIKYDFKVRLDSVSGTKQITPVILKGKKFLSDSWSTITTTNWVNGRDTTILFSQTSTSQYYKYFQVYISTNRKGFILKVPEISLNIWEQ